MVEPNASEICTQLTVQEQSVSAVFRERMDIEYGITIQVWLDHAATNYFDATSGKAHPFG
nr:hypothetical protein [Marinicella sp. W31]MDC2880252.1 hypothetical protein [Marinicella sp. W31]